VLACRKPGVTRQQDKLCAWRRAGFQSESALARPYQSPERTRGQVTTRQYAIYVSTYGRSAISFEGKSFYELNVHELEQMPNNMTSTSK